MLLRLPAPFVLGLTLLACGDPTGTDMDSAGGGTGGAPSGGGSSGSGGATPASGGDAATSAGGGDGQSGGSSSTGGSSGVGTGGTPVSTGGAGAMTADGGAGGSAAGQSGVGGSGESSNAPQIYQDLCAECHGSMAEGVTAKGPTILLAAPEMVDYLVRFGDDNETLTMQGAVVGDPLVMKPNPPAVVSDAEISAISDWLATLPRPTTGAELFAAACSYCHGASGKGGDTEYATAYHSAPFARQDATKFTAYVLAGHTAENGAVIDPSERRKYMPPFEGILSDAEISLIFQWASAQ